MIVQAVDPIPSRTHLGSISLEVALSLPSSTGAVGVPVGQRGAVPEVLGFERTALTALGFEAKAGQTLRVPRPDGSTLVAVGIGDARALDAATLRDAAAAFARAGDRYGHVAFDLGDVAAESDDITGQAVVEGVLLARYRYDALKSEPTTVPLSKLTIVTSSAHADGIERGAERGRLTAAAAALARDLANAPPAYMTATRIAEVAETIAAEAGLGVEVFDKEALQRIGCGGLLGVNAGSTEPPRMIKLTYRPSTDGSGGHLILVGKGVMYDSGGISIKPSDASHATMKMDMSGAGAVLAAMSALPALGCRSTVTAYLMCTDNMPSGTAKKLGDVLTIYGGKTVEVINTDAEGRLILADALVLASEEEPDAIVNIATLTGAAMRALGEKTAALYGTDERLIKQFEAAARQTDESVWRLPLDPRYRNELNSTTADLKNIGGQFAGSTTAALFLAEFVGDMPWAHLDIAGQSSIDRDESWRSEGASGFGTRLLIDLALNFTPPRA